MFGDNSGLSLCHNARHEHIATPTFIKGMFKRIESGYHHTLALGEEGILYSWGKGHQGQLGLGDKLRQAMNPTPVVGPI